MKPLFKTITRNPDGTIQSFEVNRHIRTKKDQEEFKKVMSVNLLKILNVGCGEEMYGTDRIDIYKSKATTKVADIENNLPYPDNTFDIVYSKNCYEHMRNPYNLLLEMKRVCKVGGTIRIITDNANFMLYLWNLCGIKHGDYRCRGDKVDMNDVHFYIFQKEHLRNAFNKAKIEIISNKLIPNIYSKRDSILQKIMTFFIGKHLGYPHIETIGRKT